MLGVCYPVLQSLTYTEDCLKVCCLHETHFLFKVFSFCHIDAEFTFVILLMKDPVRGVCRCRSRQLLGAVLIQFGQCMYVAFLRCCHVMVCSFIQHVLIRI